MDNFIHYRVKKIAIVEIESGCPDSLQPFFRFVITHPDRGGWSVRRAAVNRSGKSAPEPKLRRIRQPPEKVADRTFQLIVR